MKIYVLFFPHIEENFVRLISDLMMAGPDTTIRTLSWAILFLLREPSVQDKCRQEILSVCLFSSYTQGLGSGSVLAKRIWTIYNL